MVSKSKSKYAHATYAYDIPDSDIIGFIGSSGHSSSVMLLQKNHSITTAQSVNAVSKRAPSILPEVALQRCTLITKSKICPIAKRRTAARSRSVSSAEWSALEGGWWELREHTHRQHFPKHFYYEDRF